MVVVFFNILNLLRTQPVDNNVVIRIFALLDINIKVHAEIFNLLLDFLTTYNTDILEVVKLLCLLQIINCFLV